jgi:hypothetical protein
LFFVGLAHGERVAHGQRSKKKHRRASASLERDVSQPVSQCVQALMIFGAKSAAPRNAATTVGHDGDQTPIVAEL